MKLSLVLALLVGTSAHAFDCEKASAKSPKNTSWKVCKKSDRRGSDIEEFLLAANGDLFAYIPTAAQKICQIGSNATDVKASAHPNDAATAYYLTDDKTLYYVRTEKDRNGECPKANKSVLERNVKAWPVTSNLHTSIVNTTLTYSGVLKAWPNVGKPVFTDVLVTDVDMNGCYGDDNKQFSSYVLFEIDALGTVTKVKGNYSKDDKRDNNNGMGWKSLAQFKSTRGVCSKQH